jgi:hypothetical protein
LKSASRQAFFLTPRFEFDGKTVRLVRVKKSRKDGRGARLVARLRGSGDVDMSTDAIMALTRGE